MNDKITCDQLKRLVKEVAKQIQIKPPIKDEIDTDLNVSKLNVSNENLLNSPIEEEGETLTDDVLPPSIKSPNPHSN